MEEMMREERLIVKPFEDFRLLEYHAFQEMNHHARAELTGSIPYVKKEEYIKAVRHKLWVQVIALSEGVESLIFYGLIEKFEVEVRDMTCRVKINLCSGTRLMDEKIHIRSFQDISSTYRKLLETCSRNYENSAFIMTEGKDRCIEHWIMQYNETDWEFLKRLAAMNHTALFADCLTGGVKYHFGIPNRRTEDKTLYSEYTMRYEMKEYWHKKSCGLAIRTEDMASYIWESRDVYKLGDRSIVDGKEQYIWKIESRLKGNELYHTYFMKSRVALQVPLFWNDKIKGCSLLGKVTKVKNEKVQMVFYDDENQEKSGEYWFSFSTVYSSADGSGWYCMPEIGDRVRLYFPASQESKAYVASAYHEEGSSLRQHPERKFWRNKDGKEIQLSPERIVLTNNDGTYIELSDNDGIEIVSEGSVTIKAKENLHIRSQESSIELSAPKQIYLKQGNTEMNLGGNVSMQGAKIRL